MRRTLPLLLRALSLIAAIVTTTGVATAQEDNPRFAEIKKRGDDAMDARRPADALAAYVEAYALSPDPSLLFNKGRALQMLGDYPQAIVELEEFDKTASPELKARVPGLAKTLSELRQRVTTMLFSCDVDGAEIRVRERVIGKCPLRKPYVVNAGGDARVDVVAEGYFPWQRDLPLTGGAVATIDVHLVSKAVAGLLVIKSNVVAADVSVDGKRMGNAPIELSLDKGAHAVEVARDGYRPVKTSANVVAGERREVTIPLEAEPGILTRWWFWAGAGALILGGVTIAIVATSEKDPVPGTVPPGVVVGGLHSAGFRF